MNEIENINETENENKDVNKETNIEVFNNSEFGQVRAIKNEDGSISLNAEDVAEGLGWVQRQNKFGREYAYIRWGTFNAYCEEFGFSNKVGKDDYIPESLFYFLGMKASNEKAQEFQKWLAIDVLPEIRKHGIYRNVEAKSKSSQYNELSPEIRAIFQIDKRTVEMGNRVSNLENNMTIDYSQQEELRTLAIKKVIAILGGKRTPAYKELSKKAFSYLWQDYKRIMNVNSYRNTPSAQYNYAREILLNWVPDKELLLMIKGANIQ